MSNTRSDEDLGFYALEREDYQEAVNIFWRALAREKTARGYYGFGLANESLEDFQTARWAYHKSLDLDPRNRDVQQRIGAVDKSIALAPAYPKQRKVLFRALDNYFEIRTNGGWKPFFVKGVNLGLGVPGHYPGEYAIKKKTYRSWFEQIHSLGFNAVRIYSIHPPALYEALYEVNKKGKSLSLLQGIWAELPEDGSDFNHKTFLQYIKRQITEAVDAVFGNISLPERPGYPHGTYGCDVSPYTLGFIFGREWEGCPVAAFNDRQGRRPSDFDGSFLRIRGGNPFEAWITRMTDSLLSYEAARYGVTHPVSAVNWPTLDPLAHPSEGTWLDRTEECHDRDKEDSETLDTARIEVKKGAGFFASYHVYPYYPDFMFNDYLDEKDPYLKYLGLLKEHHGRQPVFIAEFGIPSSREMSHWHVAGWHHGGHDERRQGEISGEMLLDIHRTGMAGGALFSWFDEWFKKNWLFSPYNLPLERKALWFNFQDPESNYGLLGAYPGYPRKKTSLAGKRPEWDGATALYGKKAVPVNSFSDGSNDTRALTRLSAMADEGFLYVLLETGAPVDFSAAHYLIAVDTCEPNLGEFALPFELKAPSPVGLKFIIHLAGRDRSRILVCRPYERFLNAGTKRIAPGRSSEGEWVIMQNLTNDRRISKDRRHFFPPRVSPISALRHGSLDQGHPAFNSLADFLVSGSMIELRIPWGLINFTDPSSRNVLWKYQVLNTRKSDGIRMYALSYKPSGEGFTAAATPDGTGMTDCLPAPLEAGNIKTFTWDPWEVPLYHTYMKAGAEIYKKYLMSIKT